MIKALRGLFCIINIIMDKRIEPITSAKVMATVNSTAYIAEVVYNNIDVPVRFIVTNESGTPSNLETIIKDVHGQNPGILNGQALSYDHFKNHPLKDRSLIPGAKTKEVGKRIQITDCTL